MEDLSLHILDVVENSIRARASRIEVTLEEKKTDNFLCLLIIDDGSGMDEETIKLVTSPFYSSKEGKYFGFGVSLLKQAALETEGEFEIDSNKGVGTKIKAVFKKDHPDMKPIGDIMLTIQVLRLSHPDIDFFYNFKSDSE
ncbi:MAG: ATP-binding protein [Spirochaetia bacterium]|jgi:signal transduction histidine kinase|nr:ATP-binding protein [Spirochaetia bacterium]